MKLSTFLTDNDLNASKFAEALGVMPSTVSRWLRGDRRPSVDQIVRIEVETKGAVTASDFIDHAKQGDAA